MVSLVESVSPQLDSYHLCDCMKSVSRQYENKGENKDENKGKSEGGDEGGERRGCSQIKTKSLI